MGTVVNLPYTFVQKENNLPVVVDAGPSSFNLNINTNILYATVTVCALGALPTDPAPNKCLTIDHVQVDTGSVGLRILATPAVRQLGLLPIEGKTPVNPGDPLVDQAWEYFQFVIGGLWGPTVVADVKMGNQWAQRLRVQLIQTDNASATIKVAKNCAPVLPLTKLEPCSAMDSVSLLGANGILGIGNMPVDCGQICLDVSKTLYYSCPLNATSELDCSLVVMGAEKQVDNPVAALPPGFNNGVVLALPTVPSIGAGTVNGELIFGIDTQNPQANNYLAPNAPRINLGTNYLTNSKSYLNITTAFGGNTYFNSYLDTGSNGLVFDKPITLNIPVSGDWYAPNSQLSLTAYLSDGDNQSLNTTTVPFSVGNSLVIQSNYAFGDLAGPPSASASSNMDASVLTFAWGLPFFYGRRVVLSLWDQTSKLPLYSNGPWYSWSPI